MSSLGKVSHVVFWVAIFWLLIASFLALQFWPHLPESTAGWAAFIGFGPPVYILGEAIGEWFWSSRLGKSISNHPSSIVRIFMGVVICLVVAAIVGVGAWLASKV